MFTYQILIPGYKGIQDIPDNHQTFLSGSVLFLCFRVSHFVR
jgi:hypothetical protein